MHHELTGTGERVYRSRQQLKWRVPAFMLSGFISLKTLYRNYKTVISSIPLWELASFQFPECKPISRGEMTYFNCEITADIQIYKCLKFKKQPIVTILPTHNNNRT